MTFTNSDRERIVYYLKLPPHERDEHSDLDYRLDDVEERDQDNGTDLVGTIQGWLDELDTLEAAINSELTSGAGAIENFDKRVEGMYQQKIAYRKSDVSLVGTSVASNVGRLERKNTIILDIKRELWYLRQGNTIFRRTGRYDVNRLRYRYDYH